MADISKSATAFTTDTSAPLFETSLSLVLESTSTRIPSKSLALLTLLNSIVLTMVSVALLHFCYIRVFRCNELKF